MVRVLARTTLPSLALLLLAGCPTGDAGVGDDDDAATDDDDDDAGPSAVPGALAELSDGECPDLSSPGTKTFRSGGMSRTVLIQFPEDAPEGMPVVFVWHGLGDTPGNMAAWLRTEQLAESNDAIVVVPTATGNFLIEWDYSGTGELDLALYDDLRTCLVTELAADVNRFSSTGFSAGAVWTTALSMHRATSLATVMPMSGGLVTGLDYQTPAYAFPALLASGGAGVDTWGSGVLLTDFAATSDAFSAALREDGHLVVRCNHGGGHQPHDAASSMMERWLIAHEYGYPSPFADGDLGGLPDDCFWEDQD